MQTKKHNKRRNKLVIKSFGGGLSDNIDDLKEKPAYLKYTFLMLGISTCYIFLKLTKG